jgi:hypothetical protein
MATYPPTVNQLPSIFNPDDFYKPQTGVGTLQEVLIQGNDANNLDIVNGGTFGCDALSTPFGFINSLDASVLGDISTTGLSINPNGTLRIKGATSKGSLIAGDGTNTIELPTATNGLFLKTNSATASGLEWGSGGGSGGVSSITAGLNIGVDNTIPSAPIIRVLNPLTSTLNLGTQNITGTNGYINFISGATSEAQMSALLGFLAYDAINPNIVSSLIKTGMTTKNATDTIVVNPTSITKSVGATPLAITSTTSPISITPLTGNDCDVVVSGAGKLNIQQSTAGGSLNPLCFLTNTNTTGSVALEVYKNKPTAGSSGDILFSQSVFGKDSINTKQEYSRITTTIRDPTSGSEDGSMEFYATSNNATQLMFQLNGVENDINCYRQLDMNGNNIKSSTTDLVLNSTTSSGNGDIRLTSKRSVFLTAGTTEGAIGAITTDGDMNFTANRLTGSNGSFNVVAGSNITLSTASATGTGQIVLSPKNTSNVLVNGVMRQEWVSGSDTSTIIYENDAPSLNSAINMNYTSTAGNMGTNIQNIPSIQRIVQSDGVLNRSAEYSPTKIVLSGDGGARTFNIENKVNANDNRMYLFNNQGGGIYTSSGIINANNASQLFLGWTNNANSKFTNITTSDNTTSSIVHSNTIDGNSFDITTNTDLNLISTKAGGVAQLVSPNGVEIRGDNSIVLNASNNAGGSITLSCNSTGDLLFNGANLESGSSGSNSGQHLRIKLNGTYYKIQLLND